jgi:hypothetical protein
MALLSINTSKEPHTTVSASVLAIGPWDRGDFALASTDGDSQRCDSCDDAARLLANTEFDPEYILIAQPLPGDVTQEHIELLRQATPLAQIVIVAGSWCEGELRTGHPPEGVLRMYWHEFANWWPTRMKSDWHVYLDGPLAARNSKTNSQPDSTLSVAIHSLTLASFEAISSALAVHSCIATWVRDNGELPDEFAVGIWDGGQLDPQELTALQAFASEVQSHNGKLVVLLDFPRKHHIKLLQKLGCHAVFGKPYIIEELIAACSL